MAVLGAAAGGGEFPQFFFTTTETWVPPQDGNICIHAIGAGGGGKGGSHSPGRPGGGGGYCKLNSLAVTTSGSFTITIGAGAWGSTANNDGSGGGTTTVTGTGISSTLTAGGGGGGIHSPSANGAGGTASGGDVNNTGSSLAWYGGSVNVYTSGRSDRYSDAVGPGLGASQFGRITGGKAQQIGGMTFSPNDGLYTEMKSGGDLCGGDYGYGANASYYIHGGHGGIGGGGGSSWNTSYQYGYGGKGGNGLVIIQYIPW